VFGLSALFPAVQAFKVEHALVSPSQALVTALGNNEWLVIFANVLGDGILGGFGVNVRVYVERVFVLGVGQYRVFRGENEKEKIFTEPAQVMQVVQALQQNNHFAMNRHVQKKKR